MEDLKTNEFQKRRRQRLEQVREQSKVIARTLRERASAERSRQLGSVEQSRREDYIQRQERVVQRLEQIHEGALRAVGEAHSQATSINEKENNAVRLKDQSKKRAKLAVEVLNRSRQHDLDKKKQQLERKLIARKLANARSSSRLSKATASREDGGAEDASSKKISHSDVKLNANGSESFLQSTTSGTQNPNVEKIKDSEVTSESDPKKRDMQTQCFLNGLQKWAPSNILSAEGLCNGLSQNQVSNVLSTKDVKKSTGKQTDLFAVSPEMPEDLLGDIHKVAPAADLDNKPSLTIVSDFLRARDHRLQKPKNGFHKVTDYELQGLRETFRTTRKDFTSRGTDDICRVVDDEFIPVPSWEPVPDCGFCKVDHVPLQHSNINKFFPHPNRIRTRSRSAVNLCPRESSPFKERISTNDPLYLVSGATTQTHELHRPENTSPSRASKSRSSGLSLPLRKNRSVMHYDHSTKATRDIPLVNDKLVERITEKANLDAYSLAVKESEQTLADTNNSRPAGDGNQQRNRVAVSRQKVAQEYRDTMAFLQAMTRNNDKAKPIESAYMDDYQQHQRKVSLQRKLQQEFEKVQAVSKSKARSTRFSEAITHVDRASIHKCKQPQTSTSDPKEEDTTKVVKTSLNDAEELLHEIRKSMPLREDLSIKIPRDKEEPRKSSKTGNTVTFDTTPSTYTYTSKVKHTPPTRDKPDPSENQSTDNDRNIHSTKSDNIGNGVVELDNSSDSNIVSDYSSDYDLIIQRHNKAKSKESNDSKAGVRKFIVYKIKDSSDEDAIKKIKKKYKSTNDQTAESKSESSTVQLDIENVDISNDQKNKKCKSTFENLRESNEEFVSVTNGDGENLVGEKSNSEMECWNKNRHDKENYQTKPSNQICKKPLQWDVGAESVESQMDCKSCGSRIQETDKNLAASTATSAVTFQTATSEKPSSVPSASTMPPPGAGGYVKVLDEAGAEAGKFYIGASNLSCDDPYEVIIQLKGKNGFRRHKNNKAEKSTQHSKPITETEFVKQTSQKSDTAFCTSKTPARDFQFSSSSSTVYMSPPDLILPKILKVNNPFRNVGAHEVPKKKIENAEEKIISLSHYSRRERPTNDQESEEAKGDKRESTLKSSHKKKHHRHKSVTKSTSSMSSMSGAPGGDYKKTCRDSSCSGCPCSGYRIQRCRKKASTANHDHSRRINHQKHKQCQLEKKIMEHYQNHMQNILKNEKNKSSVASSSKSQSNLSPTIKKYINELLKMSKDEPKSAKMSTLHCSTVSTPGSSVINVPTNVDPKWSEWEQDAIQAKLNEVLTKNLIKHLKSSQHKITSTSHRPNSNRHLSNIEASAATSTSSSSGMQSVERIVGDVPRLRLHRLRTKPKSVYRNKVKSLNIAKNIVKHFSEQPQKSTKSTSKLNSSDFGQKSSDITKRNQALKSSKNISKSSPTDENVAHKSLKADFEDEMVRDIKSNKIITSAKRSSSDRNTTGNKRTNINNEEQKKSEILFKNKRQDIKHHTKSEKGVLVRTYPDNSARQCSPVKDKNSPVTVQNTEKIYIEANPNSNSDNLMHIVEEKFQNMEKIANLTEKCTKRLSNLAKVLDEVRKNKSTIYNQISSTDTSLSEKCSGKRENYNNSKEENTPPENLKNTPKFTGNNQPIASSLIVPHNTPECEYPEDLKKDHTAKGLTVKIDSVEFVPILGDIPKPESTLFKHTEFEIFSQSHSVSAQQPNIDTIKTNIPYDETMKIRAKPPPALCRVNFKNDETLIPHELSTVLEVDSPMSKNKDITPININVVISSGNEDQRYSTNAVSDRSVFSAITSTTPGAPPVSPMSLNNKKDNVYAVKEDNSEVLNTMSQFKKKSSDKLKCSILTQSHENSSEISKLQMIDLNKFNEIMMKPFISIEEYAQQYNVALLEEASNIENTATNKNSPNRDEEISSDGTLPDIISELLKRNLISEPFNFDGISNVDYNALSSESNLSLSLSQFNRNEKKVAINSQDNGDTSDTLSFSPKVDLEKAFEELGIGWASSTLKKTKETLALSSSSSTASSIYHTNYRKFKKFEANKKLLHGVGLMKEASKASTTSIEHAHPASTSVIPSGSEDKENICEQPKTSKHSVELQTSLSFQAPVSVKEFLTSSLADKITFGKTPQIKAEEHFSSLYSTKMTTGNSFEDSDGKLPANDSTDHQNVSKQTRQRTSTPVQLFKSLTFNSSTSSYNNSNGLFSNIDDLSSVKGTSLSLRNSSSTERDELTIPNCSLKVKNDKKSDCSNIS